MAPKDRDNFFKIVALIVEIASDVVWKYIKQNILGSSSFESFLNSKKEKHKLVHVYETLNCCECVSEKIKGERLIARKQLLLLYKSDDTKQLPIHKKYVGGKVTQICICNYYAIENIDIKVVDITLANYILQKCGKREQGLDNWMTQIKDVRNEIFHLSDIKELTDNEYNAKWDTLKGSILGIASLIDKDYEEEITKKIIYTKQLTVIPAYMLNYEILCRDYWRNKCAEFERAQCEEIVEKANALQSKMPRVFSESMEINCQTTMNRIQKFKTCVDKINILIEVFGNHETMKVVTPEEKVEEDLQRSVHVPAFLQLNVPTTWDETKVFDYLQDMRLSAKSDVNIRIMAISREDLNMYTEIAKTVLRNVDLLKNEINTILSGMLSEVAIDSKEVADVLVNLTVPDVQRERNSGEKTEQIEQLSGIHDEQERTIELREELSSDNYPLQLKTSLLCKINVPVIKGSQIIDCVIIGKLFVFVDLTTKRLIIHQTDGRHKEDITLPDDPRGLTAINNTDVAVLYNESYIEIISIDTGRVQNAIRTRSDNKGISYQKGLLFIHFHDKFIIDGIDLKGEIIQSTSYQTSPGSLSLQYVSTATDRLFFTGGFILYCCDWFGAILWKFTDEMMKFPEGVITDEMGNVYVGSYGYNNVIVISPDGKHYKELLTRKDGILKPRAMYYDKSSHCLLVCNERNGKAFLFDVHE